MGFQSTTCFPSLLFVLSVVSLFGGPPDSTSRPDGGGVRLDLSQCLERAIDNDPEILAERADMGIAEARHMQAAGLKYLPRFEVSNALTLAPGVNFAGDGLLDLETRNNWRRVGLFNQIELSFIQPIFSFGRIKNRVEAARLDVEVRRESMRKQRHRISRRITRLYFSRLLAKELAGLAEEALSTADKAEDTLSRMLREEGNRDLNESDLYRIRLFKIELEETGREIAKENELALSALKSSLDIPADVEFDIQDEFMEARPFPARTLEHYFDQVRIHRPEIAQLETARAARDALVRAFRSSWYPQIFIGGGAALSFAPVRDDINNPFLRDPFNFKRIGLYLGISMPLNFHQTRARIMEAGYEVEKIDARRTAAAKAVDLEVEKAYRELLENREKMSARQKSLQMAREWKTTELISFDIDGSNGRDLVDAVRAYFNSRAGFFRAIFDFNLSIAELEYATGTIGGF